MTNLSIAFGVKSRQIKQFCSESISKVLEKLRASKVSNFDKIDYALFLRFSQDIQKKTPLNDALIQKKNSPHQDDER